jgi:hypothetical protein
MKRELKAAIGATALLAGAASIVVVGGATSGNAAGVPSSAYGITASGLIPIEPTPYVESTDGSLQEESVVGIPVDGLLDAGVINAAAENDHAVASVADVSLTGGVLSNAGLDAALAPIVDACNELTSALDPVTGELLGTISQGAEDLLTELSGITEPIVDGELVVDPTVLDEELSALCDTLDSLDELVGAGAVTAECNGTSGTTTIAGLNLLGLPVTVPTGPNQALSDGELGALAPLLDVKINTQSTNADGTFTVTALEVVLLDQIDIKIASATCGHVTNDVDPTDPAVPSAPSPKPIKTDVPVTG